MLDIRHLEHQWFRYKIKKYIPFIIILVAVLFIIALALFFFVNPYQDDHSTIIVPESPVSSTTVPQEKLHVTTSESTSQDSTPIINKTADPSPSAPIQASRNNTVSNASYQPKKLEPSYDFLNNISYEAETKKAPPPKPRQQPKQPTKPKPQRQQVNTDIAPAVEKKIDTILKPPSKPAPTTTTNPVKTTPAIPEGIKISRIKSQSEIQDIIHRFKANKSPVLGLYLARYYYKMKNYEKAYNYALITNDIDPNIEESWLIFASSQMKLSKKSQAVKTLKAYIKNSGSLNARSLLNSIENGAFK